MLGPTLSSSPELIPVDKIAREKHEEDKARMFKEWNERREKQIKWQSLWIVKDGSENQGTLNECDGESEMKHEKLGTLDKNIQKPAASNFAAQTKAGQEQVEHMESMIETAPPTSSECEREKLKMMIEEKRWRENLRQLDLLLESEYNLKMMKQLGFGKFGTVCHGLNYKTGKEVAVKCQRKNWPSSEVVQNELKIMMIASSHPNFSQLHNYFDFEAFTVFIVELCGPTLKSVISQTYMVSISNGRKMAWSLVNALDFLNHHKIVHRDLHPANIVLTKNMETVKIIDFGLATVDGGPIVPFNFGRGRYCSPHANAGKLQGSIDDVISIFFLTLFLRNQTSVFSNGTLEDMPTLKTRALFIGREWDSHDGPLVAFYKKVAEQWATRTPDYDTLRRALIDPMPQIIPGTPLTTAIFNGMKVLAWED